MRKSHRLLVAALSALAALLALTVTAKALINPNFTPLHLVEQSKTILVLKLSKPDAKGRIHAEVVEALKGKKPAGKVVIDLSKASQKAWAEKVAKLAAVRGDSPVLFFVGKYVEEAPGEGGEGGQPEDAPEIALLQIDRDWVVLDRGKTGTWNMSGVDTKKQGTWDGGSDMLIKAIRYIKDNPDDANVPVAVGSDWAATKKLGSVEGQASQALGVDLDGKGKLTLFVPAETGDRLYQLEAGKKKPTDGTAARKKMKFKDVTSARKLTSKSRRAAWADFNGDGKIDLASWDGAALRLWLQGADGKFGAGKTEVPVEVNGDCLGLHAVDAGVPGRPGLLLSTAKAPLLLKPQKDGGFKAEALPAGSEPLEKLRAANAGLGVDLDGKGGFTLFVAAETGDRLYQWEAAKKSFQDVTAARKLGSKSRRAAWADFNGDGKVDLASWDGAALRLWLQGADKTFSEKKVGARAKAKEGWLGIAAVDVGTESRPDLLVSTAKLPFLLRAQKDGSFKAEALAEGSEPQEMLGAAGACLAVDLDAKGSFALFVAAGTGDRLYQWDAARKGFKDVTAARKLGSKSRHAAWADFNGDGKVDLASWDGSALRLWLQGADGKFGAEKAEVPVKVKGDCLGLLIVDAGVPGRPGLLVSTAGAPVLLRPGKDGAYKAQALPTGSESLAKLGLASPCLAADLDGDHFFDVLQPFEKGGLVYKGTGGGTFAPARKAAVRTGMDRAATCVGDYDMDGLLDVFMIGQSSCRLWSNRGKLVFADAFEYSGEMCYTAMPGGVAAHTCDINNDGLQDLVVIYAEEQPVHIYFNRGYRSFGKALSLVWENADFQAETGKGQQAGTAADLNGDGAQDLAVVQKDGSVMVYVRESYDDEPPLSVRAVLPAGAPHSGPVTVTGWNDRRCLGSWSVAAGSTGAFFGQESPGEITLKWTFPGGKEQKKVVELDKERVTLPLGGAEAVKPSTDPGKEPDKPAPAAKSPAEPSTTEAETRAGVPWGWIGAGAALVVVVILVLVFRKSGKSE